MYIQAKPEYGPEKKGVDSVYIRIYIPAFDGPTGWIKDRTWIT